MSGPETALRQFGEEAGIPNLSFDARGHAALRMESGRQVEVELAEREILVYVSLPLDHDAGAWLQRAWKHTHTTPARATGPSRRHCANNSAAAGGGWR
jgi:type III secretion system chaperone SycN